MKSWKAVEIISHNRKQEAVAYCNLKWHAGSVTQAQMEKKKCLTKAGGKPCVHLCLMKDIDGHRDPLYIEFLSLVAENKELRKELNREEK